MRELKDRGVVERIAGSGTYVRSPAADERGAVLGLLIPDLGSTDIFEPICQGMAGAPEASHHGLLWGRAESTRTTKEEQALELCNQYIKRSVSGVFFAPLELTPAKDKTNQAIVDALDEAHIPIVLLDRDIMPYPKRTRHDLVGVDNQRAGYLITEHLLNLGCRRIAFVAYPNGASTVEARIAGFREALFAHGVQPKAESVQILSSITESELNLLIRKLRPEGFVCVNDRLAGQLMHLLLALGYRVPHDVRIVGIDDVGYAKLLAVPLTTVSQPCRQIGEIAMRTMLERIERPSLLSRDILLECKLVIRESCGANERKRVE